METNYFGYLRFRLFKSKTLEEKQDAYENTLKSIRWMRDSWLQRQEHTKACSAQEDYEELEWEYLDFLKDNGLP